MSGTFGFDCTPRELACGLASILSWKSEDEEDEDRRLMERDLEEMDIDDPGYTDAELEAMARADELRRAEEHRIADEAEEAERRAHHPPLSARWED